MRQALEAAIDRKALSDVVFNGEVLPGNQWVSPKSPYFQQKFPVPGRDVAKAKKLLADAGVATPVAVDLWCRTTRKAARWRKCCRPWRRKRASI